MRKTIGSAIVLLGLAGCGSAPSNEPAATTPQPTATAPPAAATPDANRILSNIEKSMALDKEREAKQAELRKQIAADPAPVVEFAKAKMREAVAENVGNDAAAKATITADASGVKAFGDSKWKVIGHYKGTDGDGKPKETTWRVTVELMPGYDGLQCSHTEMEIDQ